MTSKNPNKRRTVLRATCALVLMHVLFIHPPASAQETSPAAAPSAKPATKPAAKAKSKAYRLPEDLLSGDPVLRKAAVIRAVKEKDVKAMGKLASMARSDPDPKVRTAASWAVGEMDLKMREDILETVASTDSSPEVRAEAEKALAKLGEYGEGGKSAAAVPPGGVPRTETGVPWGLCLKDSDCKGRRICTEPIKPTPGWAKAGGIFGLFGAGAGAGLTLAAALNKDQVVPAVPLAAASTGVTVITAAVVSSGSKSARRPSQVDGSIGMRIIGWLSFGFHITGSLALAVAVPFHWINEDEQGQGWSPPISWILVNGGLGALSLICLSADAFVAARQARDKRDSSSRKDGKVPKMSWAPYIGPTVSPAGGRAMSLGIGGTFF